VLREIRARAGDRKADDGTVIPAATLATYRVHIVSRNTFPTAAGLASSAAGYACLVHTLADVYGVKETYAGELSTIARQGSGSACRSLYGGFVRWDMGAAADGRDSLAVQVADEKHWPELVVLICVVSDRKKETGSTDGMKASVETSELLAHRASHVVAPRLAAIEAAYKARDFPAFARITMQVSRGSQWARPGERGCSADPPSSCARLSAVATPGHSFIAAANASPRLSAQPSPAGFEPVPRVLPGLLPAHLLHE
jgi:diphosphomevalonate decarboxylase